MMTTTHKIADFASNPLMAHSDETPLALSSLSEWKAFQAGMQMLQRYASHSPVDIHAVAKSNLQLLHRSLSNDAQYSDNIEDIQREAANSGQPKLQRLYTDQGFTADLLALRDGTSISLTTLPQCYAMYLLISGGAQLDIENERSNPMRHWWDRIGSNGSKNSLRSGAVIIRPYKQKSSHLAARGKNCLLLRVHVPAMEVSDKTAS